MKINSLVKKKMKINYNWVLVYETTLKERERREDKHTEIMINKL